MTYVKKNETRKKYIDAVKGFCIILVLFSHTGGIPYIGRFLFACYMQVYFVVAGITYNDRNDETLSQFVLKKAKRLLIPYVIYGIALWVMDCVLERLTLSEIFRGGAGVLYARHCLFPYQGHQDNVFLLDNLNGQLWFLPAIFISYILFWLIVKADKKTRLIIVAGYIVVNIITSFLPILFPWSLDTVFVSADLMYFGFLMKPYLKYIERFDARKTFHLKVICLITSISGMYLASVKLCGSINTSVRIWGSHGALSIPLYMIIGILGSVLFMTGFAVAENTCWLSGVCNTFAYVGKYTIVLLAIHIAVFRMVELLLNVLQLSFGYVEIIFKVSVATLIGIGIGTAAIKLSMRNQWMKLLL